MNDSQILNLDLKFKKCNVTNMAIIIFVLLNCIGCNGQVKQEMNAQTRTAKTTGVSENSEYADSIILNQYKDSKKEGVWREFFGNGQMKSEGNYKEGLKEGLYKEWGEDGILLVEGFYIKGKANGMMKWFHEKGHLAGEGNMIDGIRVGPWKICDIQENGFCIEAYFKNGKRDGIWKVFHDSARDKLWKEQKFKDDKMISEKCYDEKGEKIVCN